MAMNINGLGPQSSGANKTKQVENTPNSTQVDTSTEQPSEEVSLSSDSKGLKALEDQVKQLPEVDQSRVDKIKTAIKNGDYQIDYDRLATAFIRYESER